MTAQEPRAHQNTPRSRSVRQLRKALETTQTQKDTIRALRCENSDLRKAVKEAESQKGTIRALSGMIERLRARLRDFQDQKDTIRLLSWQVDTLRLDLDGLRRSLKKSEEEKKTLSQALSGADADHRKALRRSRRQKTTIQVLVPEECPAAQGRQGIAESDRGAGSRHCEAPLDRGDTVEEALRAQERAEEEAAFRTQARSAARRPGPRPHPTTRARGAPRRNSSCRRMRASAGSADSPMYRTAPRNPHSSRSRSKPTSV